METGEGKLHLPLDAGSLRNPELRRGAERVFEQRGLADAGLAADDEDAAVPASCCLEQPIKGRALGTAAVQHGSVAREFGAGHDPSKDRPLLWRDCWTREHD
jgi:hypothetical protein